MFVRKYEATIDTIKVHLAENVSALEELRQDGGQEETADRLKKNIELFTHHLASKSKELEMLSKSFARLKLRARANANDGDEQNEGRHEEEEREGEGGAGE